MKLDPPVNPNYAATVVRVQNLVKLQNADRLQGIPVMGLQAIVGLDTKVGDLGIIFPTECQLSFEYAYENSLNAHNTKDGIELNRDPNAKGYLEHNRRVKAIRLRGNRSDALFMPLESLAFAWKGDWHAQWLDLKEGDTFDSINGHEICRKYVIPHKESHGNNQPKADFHIEERLFPQHFETPQFFRVDRTLDPRAHFVLTQKLHGTSIRVGNIPVKRKLSFVERIARRFGARVKEYEYGMVYGSHKAIKGTNNPRQINYYDHDLWTDEGKKLDGLLPQNYILYGEIIGWTDGGHPIQSGYTYNLTWPDGARRKLYVYRVSVVNEQGTVVDLSWGAVQAFCASIGVATVPELFAGEVMDFEPSLWLDHPGFAKSTDAVPLSPESPCEEGVCLRIDDGMIPTIVKAKSPLFYEHESVVLDTGVVDLETAGAE